MKKTFMQFLSSKIFPIFFFLFLLFAAVYVTLRTGSAVRFLFGVDIYGGVAAFFIVLFLFQKIFGHKQTFNRLSRCFLRAEGFILCILIYFIFWLLLCDIAGSIVYLALQQSRIFAVSWCTAAGLSLLLVLTGALHARQLRTVPYKISLGSSGRNYRIALLSDLHLGVFVGAGYIEKVVRQVNSLSPDLVVITGDICNNGYAEECGSLDRAAACLRTLRARDGVFAVLGNHDPAFSNARLQEFFQAANIRLLFNEVWELPCLTLVGRNDIQHCRQHGKPRPPLSALLPAQPRTKPVVVLDHNPEGIDEAADCGVELALCGHTHRGQLFPFTFLARLALPDRHFYGYSTFGKTQAVISAGTGYFQLPVRLGTDSEIVDITLEL